MSVLFDPLCPPSVARRACERLWGPQAIWWEPETLRSHLRTDTGARPDDEDMAMHKLLAAQTILHSSAWAGDHQVLFGYGAASLGDIDWHPGTWVPSALELAWGWDDLCFLLDIDTAHGGDEGADCDEVDAAVAVALLHDGWLFPPRPLEFCGDAFQKLAAHRVDQQAADTARRVWEAIRPMDERGREAVLDAAPDTAAGFMARRLNAMDQALTRLRDMRGRMLSRLAG